MNLFAPYVASAPNMLAGPKFSLQAAGLIAIALAVGSARLVAQQPYNYPSQQPPADAYGQYAAPEQPQYGNPQYAQPQYPQPHYGEPQYQQPQYAQPEYGQPQYSRQQPYAQQSPEQPAYPQQDQMQPEQGVQQAQPALNADDLEQLVAPIALYPDALLAQILTASTYPAQVAVASQWLLQMKAQGYSAPDMVASGADAQSDWDPSIKALTAFPQVLDMMDQNLEWTTHLGDAYFNQPQDVMQTVQVLRERAAAAGNLQSTPQESVSSDQGDIELSPANPQEVYVPAYNPWDVYGQPVSPYPGFSLAGPLGSFFGASPINYGLGFALAAFDRFPWGFPGWAFDWRGHNVLFGHDAYFTHSRTVADWGFSHGGPRAYGGRFQSPRFSNNNRGAQPYNRTANGFDRGQSLGRPAQQFNREQPFNREQQFNRPAQPFNRTQPFGGANSYQRGENFNRGYGAPGNSYSRPGMPAQEAYNRMPPSYARPQPYAGAQAYGRSPYANGYANRPGMAFGGQAYHAPESSYPRAFAQAPSHGYSGFSSPRSGGFQSYGGGRAPKVFSGGGAPRSFGGGGGQFGGGGGNFSAPKASRSSSGGGYSGGGGGSRHHGC